MKYFQSVTVKYFPTFVDQQLPITASPQPAGGVLVRAVDVTGVYEGGDAVELLPLLLPPAPAVRPGEGVALPPRRRVELVLGDVDVETSPQ